jgi:hypothetical protein
MNSNSLWDRIFHSWHTYPDDNIGLSAQTAALLNKLNVLYKFYLQGGKILQVYLEP